MWPTEDPAEQLRWRIPCNSQGTTSPQLTVLVLGDRVALRLPAGDVLVLTPDQATALAGELDNAGRAVQQQARKAESWPSTTRT